VKFAFCLFKYFPYGGLQRDFLRIAKECMRRGHAVDVFTMSWEGASEPGLTVHSVSIKKTQNHTRSQAFVAAIQSRLAHYDRVIGFNKMPGLDVYYAADTCYQAKAREQRPFWYRLTPRYRHLLAYEKAVFSPLAKTDILLISKNQQHEFMRFYQTPPARFHRLPPGITEDRVAPANASAIRLQTRQEHGIRPDDFLLLMVGSGFKTKGLDRILLGLAALPPELQQRTVLYVIGQDQALRFVRDARALGIDARVKFLGGRDDVPAFLLAADLLVHPAYNENTGTVLLEALVSGLPVLTTDVCGYAHYVEDAKAGRVLPSPFKQTEFNQALAQMLCAPERAVWQRNALVFAKQADIYSLPKRAVDIIEQIKPSLLPTFTTERAVFSKIMALRGQVYRELEGRCTQRILCGDEGYFIKQHRGIGWKEIIKNTAALRLPVLGAKNEWLALQRLQQLNIAVPDIVSYGCRGINPAALRSFLITRELTNIISLEDHCRSWPQQPPSFREKQALLQAVARIARVLHTNGVNHRDFYICHFLLDISRGVLGENGQPQLYLIDLHRAQLRRHTPLRWVIKDLAGLYFSSMEIGLTTRDRLRFMRAYRNQAIHDIVNREAIFWQKVKKRGDKLHREQ